MVSLLLLVFSTLAHAAPTGNVVISGAIPGAVVVIVTPLGGYNSLDLTTTATDLAIASIREKSNVVNGYTLSLASANSGVLKNGVLGTKSYTAKYNGVSVSLSAVPVVVTTQGTQSSVVNLLKTLSISYAASLPEDLMQGTYTDTLTVNIIAN